MGPPIERRARLFDRGNDSLVMSPNKKVIEQYFANRSNIPELLANDAEWIEWADGVPASGVRTQGKAAYIANLGRGDLRIHVVRMTEEGNVVVAEGNVRVPKKEGGTMQFQFVDIFELENRKIKRLNSFAAQLKDSS
jgi:uncharacterized protein